MSNDALLWNAPSPPPRQPRPGELLWTLRKDDTRLDCELRSHGEHGWETQFFENKAFVAGRRFDTRAQAPQCATSEREERERDGWSQLA